MRRKENTSARRYSSGETSTRTRIETILHSVSGMRPAASGETSTRTRIETGVGRGSYRHGGLRAKHPREQGLKPVPKP